MRRIALVIWLIAFTGAAAAAEAAKPHKAAKPSRAPVLEKFSCRTGPNDEQARLIVEVVKSRPMEFAYYSPRGASAVAFAGSRRGIERQGSH